MPAQGNALGTGIPRKRMPCKGAAILGYCEVAVPMKNRILFRPHRARTLVVDVFRGRCPVLICDCPVRGEDPKAQHQNAPASRSAMPRAGRCRRRSPVRRANVVRPSRFQYRCERSGPIDPRLSFARPAPLPIGRWLGRRRYTIITSSINLRLCEAASQARSSAPKSETGQIDRIRRHSAMCGKFEMSV
jgi:hypothetical protein